MREKIQEQRSQPGVIQLTRDKTIARTVPTAPTPVREEHQPARIFGKRKCSAQDRVFSWDRYFHVCCFASSVRTPRVGRP